MDAIQYKDDALFRLFINYISDRYAKSDDFAPPVTMPEGASSDAMVALKGKSDIRDKIHIGTGAPERSPGSRGVFPCPLLEDDAQAGSDRARPGPYPPTWVSGDARLRGMQRKA
jgi:hypothetical protein